MSKNTKKIPLNQEILKEVNGKLVKCKLELSKVQLDITLPAKLFTRLNALATSHKKTQTSIILHALEKELTSMENNGV